MTTITEELKKEIAEYFISDSKEYLFRYQKLKEYQTQISNRSKLMIDIIFSIECSLKALIFIESTEDEKATYKKIKTHNLKYLFDLVSNKSEFSELEQLLNENIELYDVSSRYTLEANINFRENNILGELYYDTIANFLWLDNLHDIALSLLNIIESKMGFEFTILSFSDIDLEKEIERANRINNISKK